MIRYTFLLLILLSKSIIIFSNTEKINYILNTKIKTTIQVDQSQIDNKVFIRTAFGSPLILNSDDILKIRNLVILKVELVYTSFKQNEDFNQKQLNKNRLLSLMNIFPELFKSDIIEWGLLEQTGCTSSKTGRDFFHGFIISYRPISTKETSESEIDYINKIIKGEDPNKNEVEEKIVESKVFKIVEEIPQYNGGEKALMDYLTKSLKYPKLAKEKGIQGIVYVSFVVNELGEIVGIKPLRGIGGGCEEEAVRVIKLMPKWIPGKQKGIPVSTEFTLPIKFRLDGLDVESESVYLTRDIAEYKYETVEYSTSKSKYYVSDSTIFKIFNRNKNWDKMSVICDFTGSMSPYTVQLLVWHKLNLKSNQHRIEYFTFFNDGDNKSDFNKQIGKTGGIYHSKADNFDDIKELATTTIRNGYGGDTPENNIEAVLEAIDKCPNCNDIIMIADNFASPRDIALLSKVNKPIKIILCGTFGGINTSYLNIIRQNKGSLHTIENDILDLMNLNEGEKISIGEYNYKIKDGRFIRIYEL